MLPRSIPVKRGYVSSRLPMRYARAVKRSPRIELPSTRDDELPLRSLVATSFACLALGLAAAYGLADRIAPHAAVTSAPSEPSELAPSASAGAEDVAPITRAEPESEPAKAAAEPASSIEPAAAPELAPPADPPAAEITAPDASAPPAVDEAPVGPPMLASSDDVPQQPQPDVPAEPAEDARPLRVKPGVFAYLRCEGVPQRRGKYPCPRDRELEIRMRSIIEALPTCREAHAISRGRSFEIRLELGAGGGFKELDVNGPNEAAERAVRACAGPALRKEHTKLQPTRMIVSMRFKAR